MTEKTISKTRSSSMPLNESRECDDVRSHARTNLRQDEGKCPAARHDREAGFHQYPAGMTERKWTHTVERRASNGAERRQCCSSRQYVLLSRTKRCVQFPGP